MNAITESWVVYRVITEGAADGPPGVCTRAEWDVMERLRPGHLRLIESGIEKVTVESTSDYVRHEVHE